MPLDRRALAEIRARFEAECELLRTTEFTDDERMILVRHGWDFDTLIETAEEYLDRRDDAKHCPGRRYR